MRGVLKQSLLVELFLQIELARQALAYSLVGERNRWLYVLHGPGRLP